MTTEAPPTTPEEEGTTWAPVLATTEQERQEELASVVERVAITGDLAKIRPSDRIRYYARLCESLHLNPLTKPFEYVWLNNKLTLYARKDAADQLRSIHRVTIDSLTHVEDKERDLYRVTAAGSLPSGRRDEATGIVGIKNLTGQDLGNAIMKAETKAKRRLTLSLVGLGFLDETEVIDTPGAVVAQVDDAGEIIPEPEPTRQLGTTDRLRQALQEGEGEIEGDGTGTTLPPANDAQPGERDPLPPDPATTQAEPENQEEERAGISAPPPSEPQQMAIDPIGDALKKSRRRKGGAE